MNYLEWTEKITKEYQRYIKLKMIESQLLLSISYKDNIIVEKSEFNSSSTFQNSYIPNYKEIISKIDFFLNNKDWYNKKGIPYNLGIMLYGESLKQDLLRLIGIYIYNIINIKLNNNFCFNELKNIIYNENITDEYIIPQEKRIIIFEDIDAMCSILKDRDLTYQKRIR